MKKLAIVLSGIICVLAVAISFRYMLTTEADPPPDLGLNINLPELDVVTDTADIDHIVNLDLTDPEFLMMLQPKLDIQGNVRLIKLGVRSAFGILVNDSIFGASAMTLNPLGIISVGEVPHVIVKHELYHWWEQARYGSRRWFEAYFRELIARILLYDGDTDLATVMLSFEKRGWVYAGETDKYLRPFEYAVIDYDSKLLVFKQRYGQYNEYLLKFYFD